MNTKILSLICCVTMWAAILITSPISAQSNEDPVLFTFGDEAVPKSEFIYVYEKHNAQDSNLYSKKSVDEYLNLYTNFKLKVKEAETQGLDTLSEITDQLKQYRKQLAKSYLYDKEISEKLVKEAYDRMTKEVRTSHILFRVNEDAAPNDTLKVYNKAKEVRHKLLLKGSIFSKFAQQYSEDPSVKDNKGDLGYISAFQTVYPFESAAYNTKVGTVSEPIRTRFGYHLVKTLDVRKAQGKVQVAHILVKNSKKDNAEKKQANELKVNEIYKQLQAGADFAKLAKQSSDDRTTASNGGELPWFASGKMLPEFENAAFALQKKGDISKPFKTRIGWHVIKLLDKTTIGSYEATKSDIRKKIERDSRSSVSKKVFVKRMKKEYQLEENLDNKKWIKQQMGSSILKGKWQPKSTEGMKEKTLFTYNVPGASPEKRSVSVLEFATFAQANQMQARSKTPAATAKRLYDMFVTQTLITVEESRLEEKHPDFAKLMKEFRDGTLLFELTETRVWNKALSDSTGLQKFYDKNKNDYKWEERLDATIFTFDKDVTITSKMRKLLKKGKEEKVKDMINQPLKPSKLAIVKNIYEKGQNKIIDQIKWQKGLSKDIKELDGKTNIVRINGIVAPKPKALKDARGFVVADYQTQLEKEWVEELKQKYPVKLNKDVLKSIYGSKKSLTTVKKP